MEMDGDNEEKKRNEKKMSEKMHINKKKGWMSGDNNVKTP